MKKFIAITLAILSLMALLAACGTDSETAGAPSADKSEPAMTKNEFKAVVDSTLDESFKAYNHTAEWDGDTLKIDIWGDNLSVGAFLASSGDSECLDSWNSMRSSIEYLCDTICKAADANGLNIDVLINILNEKNLDNSILSVYDGATIYDAAN